MGLDGPLRNAQTGGDVAIAGAFGNCLGNLAFARGQDGERICAGGLARRPGARLAGGAPDAHDQPAHQRSAHPKPPLQHHVAHQPKRARAGMAERYDVIVTAASGVFPLVAVAEGKNALARALLSTGAGSAPEPGFKPAELTKRVGTVEMFTATTTANLGRPQPDLDLPVVLGGNMAKYDWTINGEPYSRTKPLHVRQGQRPTLTFDNTTMMYHPMHLHGHTFQVIKPDGNLGARKDTVNVLPNQKVSAVLVADNPGDWMIHCHNGYHQEAGMMTTLKYTAFTS